MKGNTMNYLTNSLAMAGLLLIWSGLSHGAIYKWIDENGVTNYTQYRPSDEQTGEQVKVVVPPASPKTDSGVAQQRLENQLKTLADNQAEREEAAETRAEAATEAKQRAENCEKARSNLSKLTTGGRKRIMGADGVARYMSEEQRQEHIAEAETQIKESCN
jgi:hypothetical protein